MAGLVVAEKNRDFTVDMTDTDRTKRFQQIGSILNSLINAIDEWGVSTAIAKSGIPFLQGLVALNEWWLSRRAKKDIPRLVVEELERAFDVDFSGATDRGKVENRLAKAGISDPDQAYEVALRRLTARIKQPDMLDYLGAAFNDVNIHLRRLVAVATNKYYLRRIEDMLAIYPLNEDEQKPRWFRRTGPIAADFEGGKVYRRDKDLNRLRTALEATKIAILEGSAASGKSVVARQLGFECYMELAYEEIYYLDIGAYGSIDRVDLAAELTDIKGLLIIDDAHLKPRDMSFLYNHLIMSKAISTLIVTRPSIWDGLDHRHDKLGKKDVRKSVIFLDPLDAADGIMKQYAEKFSISDPKVQSIKRFNQKSKGDLFLLAYALEGSESAGEDTEVDSWIAQSVLQDLVRMERRMEGADPHFPEICVAIAPVYMNEVAAAEPFLTKSLGYEVAKLNDLCQRGQILRIERGDDVYYALPHSAIARAYWNTGGKYRKRLGFNDYEDAVYQYAMSEVSNGLSLIMSLNRQIGASILKKIRMKGMTLSIMSREESSNAIAQWIKIYAAEEESSIKDEESKENFYSSLGHKIDEFDALGAILIIEALVASLSNPDVVMNWFDSTALTRKISDMKDPDDLSMALYGLMDSNSYAEILLNELDSSKIISTLNGSSDLEKLSEIIDRLQGYLGYSWVEEFDVDKLVETMLDPWTHLSDVSWFLEWAFDVNEDFGSELMRALDDEDYERVVEKVTGAVWIRDAQRFIQIVNLHSEYEWDWLSLMSDNSDFLGLLESEDVGNGFWLFETMCSRGVGLKQDGQKFISLIQNPDLRGRCKKFFEEIFGD